MNISVKRGLFRSLMTLMAIALIATGLAAAPGVPNTASAAREPLEINVSAGFDKSIKQGEWFPVQITVTNPGEDVSGELVIRLHGDGGVSQNAVYAKPLDLPKGSTKSIWFTLPGVTWHQNNNQVLFYEKGAGQGASIPFVGGKVSIHADIVGVGTAFIGVVARDPDTVNFLTLLNQRGYTVDTTLLPIDTFPWEFSMLDAMDVLIFNDAPTESLSAEQAANIEAWVRNGGTLILAGGAGYAKSAAAFDALSPVDLTGTSSLADLSTFEQATGEQLFMGDALTVTSATIRSGEALFEQNGIPLVVKHAVGSGNVVYFAYDLALEPLASWSGNPALWEQVLTEELAGSRANNGGNYYGMNTWELEQALEWFPQFVPPNYRMLVLMFLLYAVIVAPVLYLILRRFDRREWAWVAIPAIAVITSGLFYAVGASGRGSTLAQTLAVTELTGDGHGHRTTASSVFVPNGGDYTLTWAGEKHLVPFLDLYGGNSAAGGSDLIIRSGADSTTAGFRDVPFWSVRKIYDADTVVRDAGAFETTMIMEALQVTGEVTNQTNRDLYEAGVIIGGRWISIGELKQGEKKPYKIGAAGITGMLDPHLGEQVFGYHGQYDDRQRERALLNRFAQAQLNEGIGQQGMSAYVVGFAKYQESTFTINGAGVVSEHTEMFVQPIPFDYEQGNRVVIPQGAISMYVEKNDASHLIMHPHGSIGIGNGEAVFAFRLPQRPQWQYEIIELTWPSLNGITFDLWNEQEQSWMPLSGSGVELTDEGLKSVLTSTGQVRLKATVTQSQDFMAPQLRAEGSVVQ